MKKRKEREREREIGSDTCGGSPACIGPGSAGPGVLERGASCCWDLMGRAAITQGPTWRKLIAWLALVYSQMPWQQPSWMQLRLYPKTLANIIRIPVRVDFLSSLTCTEVWNNIFSSNLFHCWPLYIAHLCIYKWDSSHKFVCSFLCSILIWYIKPLIKVQPM